uniref:Odorant receptor n=1 Tax=Anopheles epiroticus TaxID=199890 RepID=A0A182PVW1_9DIPT
MFLINRWKSACRVWFQSTFKFSKDADYFLLLQPLCNVLHLLGNPVRCVQELGTVRGVMVLLCRFLFLLPYISFANRMLWSNHSSDAANIIMSFGTFLLYTLIMIRFWLLNHYDREMCAIRFFFKDRTYQEESDWVHRMRAGNYRRWNWIISIIYLLKLINLLIFILTNSHNTEYHFHYRGEVVGPLYVQIVVQFFTVYLGVGYFVSSCVMLVTLQLFRTEMQILTTTLRQCADIEQRDLQQQTTDVADACEAFCRQFYVNVRRHIELLQAFTTFSKVLSPISVLVYYGALIIVTYPCLFVMHNQFSANTVPFLGYVLFVTIDTLLFCQSIDNLNELNTEVGYIVYSIYWPATLQFADLGVSTEILQSLRRSMLIVLQQTQQPLRFGYGETGTLSMRSFGELMQKIYSFIMFLTQFN